MKKILIVSLFGDPLSENNSRSNNIYDYAEADKWMVTADFNHGMKSYRKGKTCRKVDYLHVPSYTKNLSIKRIFSHLVFARRLKYYLYHLAKKPDVIYCAMPTSSAAWVCGKFCRKNNIRFVIDVIDLWPDSLLPVKSVFKHLNFLLYPWKWLTIHAYKSADMIMGESCKYVEVAGKYNPEVPLLPVYLGIDCQQITRFLQQSQILLHKPENEIWICYGGSLGNSYDFEILLQAVSELPEDCKYKLLFVGGGERQQEVEQKIKEYKLNAEITGNLPYCDYLKFLSYGDIGINIFKRDTLVVHSYKFNDYVAAGLFVLNSLEGETAQVVEKYRIGRNFNFTIQPLGQVLREVCENWTEYRTWKKNNRHLITDKLDKTIIYPAVLKKILQ